MYLLLLVLIKFVTTKRRARAIVYEGHITSKDEMVFRRHGKSHGCSGSLCTLQACINIQNSAYSTVKMCF